MWAAHYDDGSNELLPVEQRVVERLLEPLSYRKVLDVGAGTGRYSIVAARRAERVLAVDDSSEMLAQMEGRAGTERIEAMVGDLFARPWGADQFDLVVCALVLCHVAELDQGVRILAEAVAPGGSLLLTDFHPSAVDIGLRTEFRAGGVRYLLPNQPHGRADYLEAIGRTELVVQEVVEIPMREFFNEAPQRGLPVTWPTTPFSLVLLAHRPV